MSRRSPSTPDHRILTRSNKQQFAVYAHYSDGTVEDITRRAQYESNDTEIAVVDAAGLVRTLAMSGEAAIMARYQGQVAVFRATVPLGVKMPDYQFPDKTLVDQFTHEEVASNSACVPSELCSDEEFIRRASPRHHRHAADAEPRCSAFVADKDPEQARQAGRSPCSNGPSTATTSPTSGPTSCA